MRFYLIYVVIIDKMSIDVNIQKHYDKLYYLNNIWNQILFSNISHIILDNNVLQSHYSVDKSLFKTRRETWTRIPA